MLEEWWVRVSADAPSGLGGLWFGIVELASPTSGWHLYVAGTELFDREDEIAEWAVPDYAWLPDGRFVPLRAAPGVDYTSFLRDTADQVRSLTPWKNVDVAGVAVGFDDGDFEIVYVR